MPDRLAELRRQRALVQEHLAWLDRELAALERTSPPRSAESPAAVDPFVVDVNTQPAATGATPRPLSPAATLSSPAPFGRASPAPAAAAQAPMVDALLEEYRVEPGALKRDVRKGCLLYFAGAMALLILVVAVLYFALSSR